MRIVTGFGGAVGVAGSVVNVFEGWEAGLWPIAYTLAMVTASIYASGYARIRQR